MIKNQNNNNTSAYNQRLQALKDAYKDKFDEQEFNRLLREYEKDGLDKGFILSLVFAVLSIDKKYNSRIENIKNCDESIRSIKKQILRFEKVFAEILNQYDCQKILSKALDDLNAGLEDCREAMVIAEKAYRSGTRKQAHVRWRGLKTLKIGFDEYHKKCKFKKPGNNTQIKIEDLFNCFNVSEIIVPGSLNRGKAGMRIREASPFKEFLPLMKQSL